MTIPLELGKHGGVHSQEIGILSCLRIKTHGAGTLVPKDTSGTAVRAVRPGVPGSVDNGRALPAFVPGRAGAPTGEQAHIPATPGRSKLLHWVSVLMLCLWPATCMAAVTELHTQRELSDVAGVFAASRYLVYKSCDALYLYFKEQGKFGPLGPSREFKISRKVFAPHSPEPGSVLTYDQNRGVFCLRGKTEEEIIKTDFTEKYTREEEQYLQAVSAFRAFSVNDESPKKRKALLKVMRWSFHAGHTEETERYAQELLLLEHRNPMRDDGSNRVHVAHTLLGLIALGRNNLPAAKESLLSSAREAPETATLCISGPNMRLSQEFLMKGEKQIVMQFLKLCERFWKEDTLKIWQKEIERGQIPDFGANLYYSL